MNEPEKLESKFGDLFLVECFDKNGNLKWKDTIKNLVVNEGLDDALDKYFKGSAYTAAHYVGLTDGTPTVAAADTMATHAGWVEVVAYDGAFITTNNTKSGTTGTLYGGGAFTAGDKLLDDNDVLNVTVTASASAS